MKKITIQGVAGCYHDAAAHLYFDGEEIQTIECETFPAMFDTLSTDASLLGIVAIENTIAGSLLQNHELLRQSNLRIIGELKLRISHVLAALQGQEIADLSEVNSHPMALMQCEQFLRRHPNLKIVERLDTAGSAKEIAEDNLRGHAAVCGEYAANLYGLNMQLTGTVRNVIDFGAFVDIGVHQDGLVHISQICSRYIRHPGEVLKVGDVVTVWVLRVDVPKKRIALTMKQPKPGAGGTA